MPSIVGLAVILVGLTALYYGLHGDLPFTKTEPIAKQPTIPVILNPIDKT